MHFRDDLIGVGSETDHERGENVGEAIGIHAREVSTVGDLYFDAGPALKLDFTLQDFDHALGAVGCEDWDVWVVLFEDGGQDAGAAAVVEGGGGGGVEGKELGYAVDECLTRGCGETLDMVVDWCYGGPVFDLAGQVVLGHVFGDGGDGFKKGYWCIW